MALWRLRNDQSETPEGSLYILNGALRASQPEMTPSEYPFFIFVYSQKGLIVLASSVGFANDAKR